MKVVSDASPLIALARIDCLELLPTLYGQVPIPTEVYEEVTAAGAGLPGAIQVAAANWIEVVSPTDSAAVETARRRTGLGAGEVSAIVLAKQIRAGLTLIDERRARRYARQEGLKSLGVWAFLKHSTVTVVWLIFGTRSSVSSATNSESTGGH